MTETSGLHRPGSDNMTGVFSVRSMRNSPDLLSWDEDDEFKDAFGYSDSDIEGGIEERSGGEDSIRDWDSDKDKGRVNIFNIFQTLQMHQSQKGIYCIMGMNPEKGINQMLLFVFQTWITLKYTGSVSHAHHSHCTVNQSHSVRKAPCYFHPHVKLRGCWYDVSNLLLYLTEHSTLTFTHSLSFDLKLDILISVLIFSGILFQADTTRNLQLFPVRSRPGYRVICILPCHSHHVDHSILVSVVVPHSFPQFYY